MASILLKAVSPGHAELRISPWEGPADEVELSVQRNEGARHLDANARQWVGDERWMRLQGARLQGDALVMPVGPDFVDTLLAGTQGPRCRGYVRSGGGEAVQHGFRVEAEVLPSSAAGQAPTVGSHSAISAPAEPPPSPPPAPPAPPAPTTEPRKSRLWLWLLLAVLIAAAAVAAYLLLGREAPAEAPADGTPAAMGCTATGLKQDKLDVMTFVQACVRDVQDPAALLAVIQAARDGGQCEIAQRLYANRANAGDITIAYAYAQEYDPAHAASPCFPPEAATARYWYEAVLEKDPKHAEARAKLQALPN
ncbi:hypothetical protein [Bordetella trematum]|uniref:hypothetical protein n=1 Tax=Bordetella trematum TaxID=123899 RepID=UPI003989E53F